MAGITLKRGVLAGKGVALKQRAAGAAIGLGLLLVTVGAGGGGGSTPAPPAPVGQIGLINYKVPAAANRSSASLETKDGAFVGPLWNNRPETASSEAFSHIDGRDYKLDALANGEYVVKISFNAIVVKYQGGIGNSSFVDLDTMDDMWRGYQFARSGEEIGNYIYVNQHYVEGPSPLVKFLKTAPQKPIQVFSQNAVNSGCTLEFMCKDSTKLYYAVYDRLGANVTTWVAAISHTNNDAPVTFAQGVNYKAEHSSKTDSTLGLLTTNDANNIITGTAVQQTGVAFFKTHDLSNTLYVHNKNTGAKLQTITSIQRPRACAVDTKDRLWMISATNSVLCYTVNADFSISPAGIALAGLVAPFNVKAEGGIIYVSDHGTSQQLKAFDEAGNLLWVQGNANGQRNGPDVLPLQFYFSDASGSVDWSGIVPRADGKFYIIEPGNERIQLFNADRTPVTGRAGVIEYCTVGYEMAIDQNDPTRLFSKYKEYKVDYSKPVTDCWKLVRNWRASAPANHFITTNEQQNIELGSVFRTLYTDKTNGRTYATCQRPSDGVFVEVELASTGLRVVRTDTAPFSLDKDGNTCFSRFNSTNGYDWNDKPRTGFDSSGNRIMGPSVRATGVAKVADSDPFDFSGFPNADAHLKTESGLRPIYQAGLVVNLYGKQFGLNWHIGLLKPNAVSWDKLLNYSTGDQEYGGGQPHDGYYDTGDHLYQNDSRPDLPPGPQVGYGGAALRIVKNLLFEKIFGEFHRGGQQNESIVHDSTTGHTIVNYGVSSVEVDAWKIATGRRIYPGFSGGVQRHEVVAHPTNPDIIYEYHGEESGSGMLNRWEVSNLGSYTITTAKVFTVGTGTTYAQRFGKRRVVSLLAKVPKRGSVATSPNCGWKITRGDDYTNKFGGGPYISARFGIKSYNIYEPVGIYFRCRFKYAGTPDSVTLYSDPLATAPTGNNWEFYSELSFEDGSANNNELGQANSGGLYCQLKDLSGKILVRFYLKGAGGSNVSIIANNKTIVTADARVLTPLWYQLRAHQPVRIINTEGVVTVKYGNYPAVTLDGPQDAGARFDSPAVNDYLAFDNNASSDRVVSMRNTELLIPA